VLRAFTFPIPENVDDVVLAAITRKNFAAIQPETRFVQVGESAAPTRSRLVMMI